MRIYEGSPRQDWEEVLRSVGAYLDDRGMRGLVFVETETASSSRARPSHGDAGSACGEAMGKATRETLTLDDEDVGKFMDDALARRGQGPGPDAEALRGPAPGDRQVPRRAAAARHLLLRDRRRVRHPAHASGQAGLKQELVEFTRDDIADLIAQAPALRRRIPRPRLAGLTGKEVPSMKALKTVAVALGITLGAILVIPLIVLAGLFVWLKLTEEDDEEALELDEDV